MQHRKVGKLELFLVFTSWNQLPGTSWVPLAIVIYVISTENRSIVSQHGQNPAPVGNYVKVTLKVTL